MKNERLSSLPLQAAADPASPDGDGSSLAETRGRRGGDLGWRRLGARRRAGFGGEARLDGGLGGRSGDRGRGRRFVANLLLPDAARDEEGREDREEQPREGPTTGRTGRAGALDRGRVTDGRVAREPAPPPPSGPRREWTSLAPAPRRRRSGGTARAPRRDGWPRHGRRPRRAGHAREAPSMPPRSATPRSAAVSPPGQSMSVTPLASASASCGSSAASSSNVRPFGDPEVGLAPALVDLHVRDPGGRREDLRGGARAARRARDDQDVAWQRRGERRGERTRCRETARRQGAGRCARSTGVPSSSSTRGGRTRPRSRRRSGSGGAIDRPGNGGRVEGRHAVAQSHGRVDQADREGRSGPLAQSEVEVQQWPQAESLEHDRVTGFDAAVRGDDPPRDRRARARPRAAPPRR